MMRLRTIYLTLAIAACATPVEVDDAGPSAPIVGPGQYKPCEMGVCAEPLECIDGYCSVTCTDDAECSLGACVDGVCHRTCVTDDCPQGLACVEGVCR